MDRAAWLLARAWHRAWRRWWWGSAAALALVLLLVLGTAGLLDGMQRATTATVADFYTGDLRVTAEGAGAAPDARFPFHATADLDAARRSLEQGAGRGASAVPRLETTGILSRRTLLEAFLTEQDQYGVAVPGVEADRDAYRVGILSGLPMDDAAVHGLVEPYLVAGRFPHPAGAGNGTIEVLLSERQYRGLLDPGERAALPSGPTEAQLSSLRLELTAAHLASGTHDLLRARAIVVGLFASGVEGLDRLTVLAPIEDVRVLLGAAPDAPVVNAFAVVGGDTDGARRAADSNGWSTEEPGPFAHRYLGQLLDFLRAVGLVASILLLGAPVLLVWVGLAQQLDRSRRELAVGRAIGIPCATVRRSLLLLSARVLATAIVGALLGIVLVRLAFGWWSPGHGLFPVPVAFAWPLGMGLAVTGLLVVSAVLIVWLALRRHQTVDLGPALRTF